MVLVSLSCVLTIVILNIFYRGTNGRRVPSWAKLYIMHYLGRVVCSRHNKVGDSETETLNKVSAYFIDFCFVCVLLFFAYFNPSSSIVNVKFPTRKRSESITND